MTNQKINSTEYIEFVKRVTSEPSSNVDALVDRIRELDDQGVKLTHLLTFALGMIGELGETVDIIKKVLLQEKKYGPEIVEKLHKESSDISFYFAQFCIAMGVDFEDIMQINFDKLSARYPEGHFSVERSENRKEGDI
jgi:NTP pyrophosphatase (non-canonical NTP hydrolase)